MFSLDESEEIVMTAITSGLQPLLPSESLGTRRWLLSSDIVTVGSYFDGFHLPFLSKVQLIFQHETDEVRISHAMKRLSNCEVIKQEDTNFQITFAKKIKTIHASNIKGLKK